MIRYTTNSAQNDTQWVGRIDRNFGEKFRVFGSYFYDYLDVLAIVDPTDLLTDAMSTHYQSQHATLSGTYLFGPSLTTTVAAGLRVRQVSGRYTNCTDFDFMMHMGVWTENLALPSVLNECILQSYTGTIRLFPNIRNLGPARFENLRAAGAFLVSASYYGKSVSQVSLLSEKGKAVRLANPWQPVQAHVTRCRDARRVPVQDEAGVIVFPTDAGERYRIEALNA